MDKVKPVRVQRSRQYKMVSPNGLPTVYVGRGSRYGNPFRLGKGFTHELVVDLYKEWLNSPVNNLAQDKIKLLLKGKNLVCWCKLSEPCHADVLLEIANR